MIGCPITFAATAVDVNDQILTGEQIPGDIPIITDDGIDRVEFYVNDRLLATDDLPPYEVTVARDRSSPPPTARTPRSPAHTTTTPRS
ncbi:Ig-like domain-containing protein [Phytohabitans suffuscus]|uniref:Ig-like domain-containing protein n=1 Tax=Phytohabitans suffuscus TaxID=624315 RepID=UPI0015676496|nr:Ig-like domain-containing protein [Phytohabitans suffuscus]